ncbi:unnamed protein product [Leptidea sinapis]|uniref:Mediator of RNA polymerase II transcription subunit 15 n=1 Tax=Leptidea sinapis TaxID=189913 RepID=A0A5E4Q7K7_9NEOP|nr:unnamed protein product [Leptidea sinapis]
MDNTKFNTMAADDNNWRTQSARQTMVAKIEEVIQRSGMQVARNSSEMENHVFMKAKTREEYMNMIAKLILHHNPNRIKEAQTCKCKIKISLVQEIKCQTKVDSSLRGQTVNQAWLQILLMLYKTWRHKAQETK